MPSSCNAPVPQKACFAIAGPVVNNTAKLTNLTWFSMPNVWSKNRIAPISNQRLCSGWLWRLGLRCLRFMHLATRPAASSPDCGDWGWHRTRDKHFNSAGRHVSGILFRWTRRLCPCSELEFQLLKYPLIGTIFSAFLRSVSGQGIVAIYQFPR